MRDDQCALPSQIKLVMDSVSTSIVAAMQARPLLSSYHDLLQGILVPDLSSDSCWQVILQSPARIVPEDHEVGHTFSKIHLVLQASLHTWQCTSSASWKRLQVGWDRS